MSYDVPKINPRFCGNCGQKLLEGATFCAYCGTPVPPVDSTGVVSSKSPPSYTSIPPTVRDSDAPMYPASYRPEGITKEPPHPFTRNFQRVLMSPQLEMAQIVERPNLKQPLMVVLIVGILAGIGVIILYSKITFTPEFIDDFLSGVVGYSPEMIEDLDMESFVEVSFMLGGFLIPIFYIIGWIFVNTLILWALHSVISSKVPSHERTFKTMATITGWSYIPRIFAELINTVLVVIFVPQTEVSSMADLMAIESFESVGEFVMIFSVVSIIILLISFIWGGFIIFFASKAIDPDTSHAAGIVILYIVIRLVIFFFAPLEIPI